MAVNLQKANRIIFQPTKDNEEKLKRLAKENGLTISGFLNQVISDLDDRASLGFGGEVDRNDIIDMFVAYDQFKALWNSLETTIDTHVHDIGFLRPVSTIAPHFEGNPWWYDDRDKHSIKIGRNLEEVYPILEPGDSVNGDKRWDRRVIQFCVSPWIMKPDDEHITILPWKIDSNGNIPCKDFGYDIYALFYGKVMYIRCLSWNDDSEGYGDGPGWCVDTEEPELLNFLE